MSKRTAFTMAGYCAYGAFGFYLSNALDASFLQGAIAAALAAAGAVCLEFRDQC